MIRPLIASVVAALVLGAASCNAAIVTYEFTATVDAVADGLLSEFSVGESIVGTFTYDSEIADGIDAVSVFDATIGGDYSVSASAAGTIDLTDGVVDSFSVLALSSGAEVGGATPFLHSLILSDATGNIFSDSTIPAVLPDLGAFTTAQFTLSFPSGDGLIGTVSTLTAVPEPSGFGLLALAGAIAGYRRRRR